MVKPSPTRTFSQSKLDDGLEPIKSDEADDFWSNLTIDWVAHSDARSIVRAILWKLEAVSTHM